MVVTYNFCEHVRVHSDLIFSNFLPYMTQQNLLVLVKWYAKCAITWLAFLIFLLGFIIYHTCRPGLAVDKNWVTPKGYIPYFFSPCFICSTTLVIVLPHGLTFQHFASQAGFHLGFPTSALSSCAWSSWETVCSHSRDLQSWWCRDTGGVLSF